MYPKRLSREKELKNVLCGGKFLSAQGYSVPRILPIGSKTLHVCLFCSFVFRHLAADPTISGPSALALAL